MKSQGITEDIAAALHDLLNDEALIIARRQLELAETEAERASWMMVAAHIQGLIATEEMGPPAAD